MMQQGICRYFQVIMGDLLVAIYKETLLIKNMIGGKHITLENIQTTAIELYCDPAWAKL